MPPTRIMIIRHGEKPEVQDDGTVVPPLTVLADGDSGKDDLSPRGWQRSGALARFFAPNGGDPGTRPTALFAAQVSEQFTSLRTQQTIAPLAALLHLVPICPAPPDGVDSAAKAILAAVSPALVCWEHKNIAKLVAAITGNASLAPHWSGKRFDMILVLEHHDGAWILTQVPQKLLSGDSDEPLKPRKPGQEH